MVILIAIIPLGLQENTHFSQKFPIRNRKKESNHQTNKLVVKFLIRDRKIRYISLILITFLCPAVG